MTYDELFSKYPPSQFMWEPVLSSMYGTWMYEKYAPIAYDMFQKICDKMNINRNTLVLNVLLPVPLRVDVENNNQVITRLGMFYAPSRIDIYLFGIAVVVFENMDVLHRTDFDTMMKAEIAHTIIHEISHSQQMTYTVVGGVEAMEYANERRIMDEIYPLLEYMLKRNYKIDLTKDRVPDCLTNVYSTQYILQDSFYRILNYLAFNFYDYDSNCLNDEQLRYIIGFRDNLAEYGTIYINILPNPFHMEGVYRIKKNGIVDYKECDRMLSHMHYAPLTFGFDSNFSGDDDGVMNITISIKYSKEYNPITHLTGDAFPMDNPPPTPDFFK